MWSLQWSIKTTQRAKNHILALAEPVRDNISLQITLSGLTQSLLVRMIFFLFGNVEERSLQRIFSPNWGAKQAKTPHEALMNHRLTTIIYFGTDNTKSADILPVLDYM